MPFWIRQNTNFIKKNEEKYVFKRVCNEVDLHKHLYAKNVRLGKRLGGRSLDLGFKAWCIRCPEICVIVLRGEGAVRVLEVR